MRQPTDDFQPAHPRHHQVQHEHVGLEGFHSRDDFQGIGHFADNFKVGVRLKYLPDPKSHYRMIICK
jgi:hypothetical protein